MQAYRNLRGNSGVTAYESGSDFIKVEFNDGSIYLYSYASTGSENIEQMKKLAQKGKGLTTFINKFVRERYEEKLT